MWVVFLIYLGFAYLLCLPCFIGLVRTGLYTHFLLLVVPAPLFTWNLAAGTLVTKSLSNIVEFPLLFLFSVLLTYFYVYFVRVRGLSPRRAAFLVASFAGLAGLLVALAIPTLPE